MAVNNKSRDCSREQKSTTALHTPLHQSISTIPSLINTPPRIPYFLCLPCRLSPAPKNFSCDDWGCCSCCCSWRAAAAAACLACRACNRYEWDYGIISRYQASSRSITAHYRIPPSYRTCCRFRSALVGANRGSLELLYREGPGAKIGHIWPSDLCPPPSFSTHNRTTTKTAQKLYGGDDE